MRILLKSLRGQPPRAIVKKIYFVARRYLNRTLQRWTARAPQEEMADQGLRRALAIRNDDLLAHFRTRTAPRFFIDPADRDRIVQRVRHEAADAIPRTMREAAATCDHVFNLLGSGDVALGESIDWQRDFKSGFSWDPHLYHADVRRVDFTNNADVKVPWDLSRFHFLTALGKAYWFTKSQDADVPDGTEPERYAREFVTLLDDWLDKNPAPYGVNWTCPMEVAIRAVNWIWGLYFFRDSPHVDARFFGRLLKSLLDHGRYIYCNLEYSPLVNNNHYLSNLVGLLHIGILFPEFRESKRWRSFAVKELAVEMEKEVFPDGVSFEASIPYHRLVAELFLATFVLCELNEITLPAGFQDRLEKMLDFVMAYTKTDGTAPQMGDADDGQLIRLTSSDHRDRALRDHRYLLALGGVLFDRPDLLQAAADQREDMVWLLSCWPHHGQNAAEPPAAPPASRAFPDGGYYVMRSEQASTIVDCIPDLPHTPSGHRHNSRLGFDLSLGERTYLADPGTYLYTASPTWRNRFRSTAYHTTILVDDTEMDVFSPRSLFRVTVHSGVRVRAWNSDGDHDFLDADHTGYERLSEPVTHRRQIFFDKTVPIWIVRDLLTGAGEHTFDQFFHFAPVPLGALPDALEAVSMETVHARDRYGLIDPTSFDAEAVAALSVSTECDGPNLAVLPLNTQGLIKEVLPGWVSHRYGTKQEAPVLKFTKRCACPACFVTLLYPIG